MNSRCNYCGAPQPETKAAEPRKERCASCGQTNPRAGRGPRPHPSRKLTLDVIERTPVHV